MQDTYHVDHSSRKRRIRRRRWVIASLFVLTLLAAGLWLRSALKPETTINQSQPFSTTVGINESKLKIVSLSGFQIGLPADWASQTPPTSGADYSWHGTAKGETARSLDIYQDEIPGDKAVNRLLPIKVEGDSLIPTDTVSDNCINFTDVKTANPLTGAAPSKWSGVNFLCDTANEQRVVVGTSTAESINTATVSGVSGTHRYFFVYTDHGAQPNFEVFIRVVGSFKAL